jgi:antirestriction protein ArdC
MTTIYGDVIPTPHDVKPWAAVLYSDTSEIKRAAADTRDEAQALVAYFLEKLAAYARLAFEDLPGHAQ